jgi:methylglutamate dehydrogenase subunit D
VRAYDPVRGGDVEVEVCDPSLSILSGCASMPDLVLQARAPLAGFARPGRSGADTPTPGLLIEERTGLALATVIARRGKERDLKSAVAEAYGLDLPNGPRVVWKDGVSFAGIGVGQWFVVAGPGETAFVRRLRARLAGLASIADQSDGRVVRRLRGDRVRDVVAKGVPLDLYPTRFRTGDVASTLVAHIGVQIEQLDDQPTFQLVAFRSLAGSLWSWLTKSAAEFGYELVSPAPGAV